MATLISHNPAETEALGEQWGRDATSSLIIALTGDLGAGKTQLVKGIARGLGIESGVHSPTFTILNEYRGGRLTLFHLDLYRLETRQQIIGAGLDDSFYRPDGIAVIEWAERWFGQVPSSEFGVPSRFGNYRRVQIEVLDYLERRITYEDLGA